MPPRPPEEPSDELPVPSFRVRAWQTWVPSVNLVGAFGLVAGAAVFTKTFRPRFEEFPDWTFAADSSIERMSAHLHWMGTTLIYAAAIVAAVTASVLLLARTLEERWSRTNILLLLVLPVAGYVVTRSLAHGFPLFDAFFGLTQPGKFAGMRPVFEVLAIAGEVAGLIVSIAMVSTFQLRTADYQLSQIAERTRQQRFLLFVGAILFVVAMAQTNATFGLILSHIEGSNANVDPGKLVGPILYFSGAVYTVWLVALYLPGAALLRTIVANGTCPDREAGGEKREEWVRDIGFGLGTMQVVPRVLALVAPALASQILQLVQEV